MEGVVLAALWIIGFYSLLRLASEDGVVINGLVAMVCFVIIAGGSLTPAGATSSTFNSTNVLIQRVVTLEDASPFEAIASGALVLVSVLMTAIKFAVSVKDDLEGD